MFVCVYVEHFLSQTLLFSTSLSFFFFFLQAPFRALIRCLLTALTELMGVVLQKRA